MFYFTFSITNFCQSPYTFYCLKICLVLCIGQSLGQDPCFREQFDVAVARAVAEMRILGKLTISWFNSSLLWHFVICYCFSVCFLSHFQLNIVFLWFVLVGCLLLPRVMILRYVTAIRNLFCWLILIILVFNWYWFTMPINWEACSSGLSSFSCCSADLIMPLVVLSP